MSRARFRVSEGSPLALGPTADADGVNFAPLRAECHAG